MAVSMCNVASYHQWREHIKNVIANGSADHEFFWLIDACAHPDVPQIFWELDASPDAWPLYMNSYYETVVNSGPFLVRCTKKSPISHWLLQQMENFPIAGLLTVHVTMKNELFYHLQNLIECWDPNQELSLFRYYDPRIVYAVKTFNDSELCERILGPVLFWDSWEPGRATPITLGNGIASQYRCNEPHTYSDEFISHIWDEVQLYTLIQALGTRFSGFMENESLHAKYKELEKTYSFISGYGFTDRYSITLGACIAIVHGTSIWENKSVKTVFEAKSQTMAFSDICDRLGLT